MAKVVKQFDDKIAMELGVEAAILYANIEFWVDKNRANGKNFHDGYYWTYNSTKAFAEQFPYWSSAKIRRALEKLEDAGYIKTGNYNKVAYDRTKWYTCTLQNEQMHFTKMKNGNDEIVKPIPDINTDRNQILDTKVSKAKQPSDYGNSDINEMFRLWQSVGLPAITARAQQSRRTIWNMLRNKQIGAERLKHGIELAGEAYGEPYAPTVFNFEDLNRKLTALEAWKQKQSALAEQPKRQPSASSYSPTYSGEIAYERRPYDERPAVLDYERSDEVVSDEFLEQCRKKFM